MDNEIKNLKQKDIENQKLLQISFLELSRVEKKLADLKSSKKHSTIKFYDDKIEAIGNNTNDLQTKVILLQSEGSRLLVELEDYRENLDWERSFYGLNLEAKKFENKQLTREKECSIKQNDDYQIALEDAINQIAAVQDEALKWEKLYREKFTELADLKAKYVEQESLNNPIYGFFNNSYATVSNFGKISLILVIIYYSFKIIKDVSKFFKRTSQFWSI